MGSVQRREREREQIRQMIMDAAMSLFVNEGFEKVTIRNIAEAIEYTPGAIYSYFKDKDEIFYALHLEAFGKLFEVLRDAALKGNPMERLHNIGKAYMQFGLDNPQQYDLMFISTITGKQIAEKMTMMEQGWHQGQKAFEVLVSTIQLAIDEGYMPKGNAKAAGTMFWSLVHGIVSLLIRNRCVYSPEETRRLMKIGYEYMMKALMHGEVVK
jgi:AcrR family transcriptional regulator